MVAKSPSGWPGGMVWCSEEPRNHSSRRNLDGTISCVGSTGGDPGSLGPLDHLMVNNGIIVVNPAGWGPQDSVQLPNKWLYGGYN